MQNLPDTPFKLLLFFLLKKKKPIFGLMFLACITGLIPAFDSILSKKLIDTVESLSNADSQHLLDSLFPWAVTYALWWESVNWLYRILDYLHLKTLPLLKTSVVDKFYTYIQHHSAQFFQDKMVGYITNRVTEASRSIERIFELFAQKVLMKGTNITASIATMYWVHPVFAAILLTWMVFFIGTSAFFSHSAIRYSEIYAGHKATIAGKIVDVISNIASVRMFSRYRHEQQFIGAQLDETVKSERTLQWFMLKLRYVQSLSCSVMIFVMVYYLGVLRAAHEVTLGDFALILMLCVAIANDIWDIVLEIGDLFEEYGVFSQSISLIEPYLITDKKNAPALKISKAKIEFREVSFQYKEDARLFTGKNIIINGGEKVGLVGYSGSGKSTFVSLISRLYDVAYGQILIDNQNIKDVAQESLRCNISLIPQEPILFHRSVKENIGYGSDASYEEIVEAAQKAHIHDVIMALPEGYDTLCGERGNNLSGGQRQRVIIARAILKNTPILILDEATSALDTITEKYIQASMKYLMNGKTVLVIAHRLSTLLDMDRILVFDRGVIAEDGSHTELLQKKGLYYRLWNSQVEGFLKDQ
jgi:ATP-binding cassette subfamily B protein